MLIALTFGAPYEETISQAMEGNDVVLNKEELKQILILLKLKPLLFLG